MISFVKRTLRKIVPAGNLPNLFILGAQKCGTSSLHHYLIQHPSISGGRSKEIHFFDYDLNYSKGINWYRNEFPESNKFVLDSSPRYLYDNRTPERINKLIGQSPKFIILLRDPISRAESAYMMYKRFCEAPHFVNHLKNLDKSEVGYQFYKTLYEKKFPTIEELIHWEITTIENNEEIVEPSIIRRGFYKSQIEHWFNTFNPESFFFIENTQLEIDKLQSTLNSICEFLEIENFEFNKVDTSKKNTQKSVKEKIDTDLTLKLKALFEEQNSGLNELIGSNFDW